MINKTNCWEHKNCGREPDGARVKELGVCPAATSRQYHGTNHGKNAGRYCWAITGTLCKNSIQGTYAEKLLTCISCNFFLMVQDEEGRFFTIKLDDQ